MRFTEDSQINAPGGRLAAGTKITQQDSSAVETHVADIWDNYDLEGKQQQWIFLAASQPDYHGQLSYYVQSPLEHPQPDDPHTNDP